jgi:hypothetical protein
MVFQWSFADAPLYRDIRIEKLSPRQSNVLTLAKVIAASSSTLVGHCSRLGTPIPSWSVSVPNKIALNAAALRHPSSKSRLRSAVGVFSIMVNLLVLAIPVYLFNLSDRVLQSRSTDTLVMLTIIVVAAIAAHVLMDVMRRLILMRVAVDTEARVGEPVLSAAAKAAQGGSSREFQTLADLQHLRVAASTGQCPVALTADFDGVILPHRLDQPRCGSNGEIGGEDFLRRHPKQGNKPTAIRRSGEADIAIFADISTT